MTRCEELERLRDAVMAGDTPLMDLIAAAQAVASDGKQYVQIMDATRCGDMNAALAFVDAALPASSITLTQDPSGFGCRIVWWPGGLSGLGEIDTGTVVGPALAVTCLVACLKALIAQEGQV